MASGLYRQPYEAGKIEGEIKGKLDGKTELVVRVLSKKFGVLPVDILNKISKAEQYQLDLIAEGIFDFQSIDDTRKYLQ